MTPPSSPNARSGCKKGRFWLTLLAGWVLLTTACALPANPFNQSDPFTASTDPAPLPTVTLPVLPTPVPQVPPALVETHPLPGSQLDRSSGITFYFNQAMDRASVESAMQIEPPLTGEIEWQDDATLHFVPDSGSAMAASTIYNVRFGPLARAQNGLEMSTLPDLTYRSPGQLELVEGLPTANDPNVDPSAAVVAVFNQPVVPLSAEDRSSPPAFTLEPEAPGRGEWSNTSTYVFYPEPALAGGVQYTVTLNSDLTATTGAGLLPEMDTHSWRFTTANPRLISLQPEERNNLLLDGSFELTFNQSMNRASIREHFQLRAPDGESVSGSFAWHDDDSRLVFTPAARLNRSSAYQLSLSPQAESLGGTPLGTPVSVDYTTLGPLELVSRDPAAGELVQIPGGYGGIALQFNAPLNEGSLERYFQVEPPLSNTFYYVFEDRQRVEIYGNHQYSTTYMLTISGELRDRWNRPLGQDLELVYATAPAEPDLHPPMLSTTRTLFMLPDDVQLPAEAINLSRLDITASPLNLADFLTVLQGGDDSLILNSVQNERWQQPLQMPADRMQVIDIPLAEEGTTRVPGLYHFNIRSPDITSSPDIERANFAAVVSHIQLLLKRSSTQAFIWALDLNTNRPVAGAEVILLDQEGDEIGRLVTASDGTGHAALTTPEGYTPIFAVTGSPGDPDFSLAMEWNAGINPWNFGLDYLSWQDRYFAYAYTDRPIYMPGQTVHFRAAIHQQENGRYSAANLEQVNISIVGEYSLLAGERPVVAQQSLAVSEFGTVTGSFQLPVDAIPGTYTLSIQEVPATYLDFQVATYRKPEIDLSLQFDRESYLSGEPIEAVFNASYFSGGAVSELPVTWALFAAEDPLYLADEFRTGTIDLSRSQFYGGMLGTYLTGGEATTGPDGSLTLNFTGSDLEALDNSGHRQLLTLEATILRETEDLVSTRASAVLHPADFYIGVRPESYSVRAGSEAGFSILTVDTAGKPSGEHVLQAGFQKVIWPDPEEYKSFGELPEPELTLISSSDFQTGADGQARLAFTPPEPGVYQLQIAGGGAATQVLIWVGGDGSPIWPSVPNQHISLQADQSMYQPGDSARVFVPNPFGAGAQALVTIERGRVMRSEVLTADGPNLELSIPLTSEDAPNVYLSVILTGRTGDGRPDFRTGYLQLTVDPAEQLLQVEFVGSPQRIEPNGEVTFNLQVMDSAGEPVQGEFSLALVDKAVLALAEPNVRSIDSAYYGRQPLGVSTNLSLAAYNRRMNLTPDGNGRGGGPSQLSPDVRTLFEDTAYWNGAILTGADGRAEVVVTLPDNLTTWVALVRGLDHETRVGEAEVEVVATKDLLVRPQAPRFMVAGDHVVLGAHIHNNTGIRLAVAAQLKAVGFELDEPDRATQEIQIPAGGQQYVTWAGTAQAVENVELVFSAVAGALRDAAVPEGGSLPVLKYHAPLTYGTTGVLADAGERLEVVALPRSFTPTGGSLRVELSPSLAAAILDELKTQPDYLPDFTEAILSSFLPNLQALQALRSLGYSSPELESDLENAVAEGITTLQRMQNEDGGWGMTSGTSSDPHISSYVLFGLAQASSAGQAVDPNTLERGRTYLLTNLAVPDAGTQPAELDRLAFQNFALQQAGAQDPALQRLYDFREDMNPWAQGLLALTLAGNDPQDARGREIVMALKDAVRRSATGVHWEERHPSPTTFSTGNFNTAVVIYTLAKLDPATPILPDAVRYLISARRAGGGWASSYETAWSLLALTQAQQGTADVQAEYAYSATLDGAELAAGQASATALDPIELEVGLDRLRTGQGSELRIRRESGSGRLYYRSFLQLYRPVELAEAVSKGLHVERRYYRDGQDCRAETCVPQDSFGMTPGAQVLVRLTLTLPQSINYLVVEDFIPAGAEIIDTRLKTTQLGQPEPVSDGRNPFDDGWNGWIFGEPRISADRIWWIAQEVPAGTYELTYRLQPLFEGDFRSLPAHAYSYYFPDVEGSSAGGVVSFRRSD